MPVLTLPKTVDHDSNWQVVLCNPQHVGSLKAAQMSQHADRQHEVKHQSVCKSLLAYHFFGACGCVGSLHPRFGEIRVGQGSRQEAVPKREGLFFFIRVAATITTVIILTRAVFDGVAEASGRVFCALHGSKCRSVRCAAALRANAACIWNCVLQGLLQEQTASCSAVRNSVLHVLHWKPQMASHSNCQPAMRDDMVHACRTYPAHFIYYHKLYAICWMKADTTDCNVHVT